jgi:hypothetical protein
MYNEYKRDNVELKSQSKQSDRQNQSQTLNDTLNDDVIAQISSDENEFISYQRQDKYNILFVIIFVIISFLIDNFNIICTLEKKNCFKTMK